MTRAYALASARVARFSGLSPDAFEQRDALLFRVLLALIPALTVLGIARGNDAGHVVLEVTTVVGCTAIASRLIPSHRWRASMTSFALMMVCSLLVHFTGGLAESHFAFFVLLPLVALYRDWVAFVMSVAVVLLHHGLVGSLSPKDVYAAASAQRHPIVWAGIHAAYVVGLILVLLVYWTVAEHEQEELRAALADLKAAQDELVRSRKLEALGELAAGVAHEINTPIQYIGDNIGFLTGAFREIVEKLEVGASSGASELPDDDLDFYRDEIPAALAQSAAGVTRVAEIVRALKGVTHPGVEEFESADLNQLISDTVLVARGEWKHVALVDLAFDPDLPRVECVAGQISQVLLNMVVNSAHAVAEHHASDPDSAGRIRIETRSSGDNVTICVSDNGPGVPAAIATRIFDPFFTTKPVGKGTGQGLAISRAVIADLHHGTIDVTDAPAGGARFVITLPTRHAVGAGSGG